MFHLCPVHALIGDAVVCESFKPGHRMLKLSEMNMWLHQIVIAVFSCSFE